MKLTGVLIRALTALIVPGWIACIITGTSINGETSEVYRQTYIKFQSGASIYMGFNTSMAKSISELKFPEPKLDIKSPTAKILSDLLKLSPSILLELQKTQICFQQKLFHDLGMRKTLNSTDTIQFEVFYQGNKPGIDLVANSIDEKCYKLHEGSISYYLHPEIKFDYEDAIRDIKEYGSTNFDGKKILRSELRIILTKKLDTKVGFIGLLLIIYSFSWALLILFKNILVFVFRGFPKTSSD